jgi:hypothetical protein
MHDIDFDDKDRWNGRPLILIHFFADLLLRCEYILYRGLYRTSYARLSRSTVTDTELQIGQFMLPRHGMSVRNDTEAARYIRSYKESLPPDHVSSRYSK